MWVAGSYFLNQSHISYVQHGLGSKVCSTECYAAYSGLDGYMPQYCDAIVSVISCHHHKVIMRFTWSSAYTYLHITCITPHTKYNSELIPEAREQCLVGQV